ncbi:hypothetical protein DICPUDRAFT_149471 [Dictyostelium purpureum]|uniref:Uncharacterized protein n=1 Tax=Dictyostelium purpureum TaxID=5786 RepID=F0ZDU1_DICPU|nr:uncharacterized protein DICPUDRAFT_149471 [Dictyostelium purpureum]EGC37926.1 hypothetical protein DICPUDRAFT_149471 [Dictyostelium purpureum]|eukprot:XP_003285586.1 hypothetical protein DICPUDRAFT_149471 [Dictyostelium purpureum]
MDVELFEDPVEKLKYNIITEEPNALNKFLQIQKHNFTDAKRFISLKSKGPDSANIRNELNQKKSFPYKTDSVNAGDAFLAIAYKFSDRFNIDEFLSCRILYHIFEHSSTRNEIQLLEQSEKFIFQNRSCYLQFLREILFTLQGEVGSKLKHDTLQQFVGDLISEQSNEKNILNILIKTLEEKVSSMNVTANPLECSYRIKECTQIAETLFLISVQFTIREDIIKLIIRSLNLCIEKQVDQILKNSLFEIIFLQYFTLFSIFDGTKNSRVYNPIEKRFTHNHIERPDEIENEIQQIQQTQDIKPSLLLIYNLVYKDIKGDSDRFGNQGISNKLPFEGDPYIFLLNVVQAKEFQVSQLTLFLSSFINILSCKYITFLPEKQSIRLASNAEVVNNFNFVMANIFDNQLINSHEFWRRGEETGYFGNYLWFQIPDHIIISSFRLMGSLARSNTVEVYNFFATSGQFSWHKLFQDINSYVKSLNGSNSFDIAPKDIDVLTNILLLVARLVESSIQVSVMITKTHPIIGIAVQFSLFQVETKLKSAALRLITAFSKYTNYLGDIWKFCTIDTQLLRIGLSLTGGSNDLPIAQQSLELLSTIIHNSSNFIFDKNSSESVRLTNYLDQCMELFNFIDNKSFNNFDEKWKFALSIVKIFEYCLKQFNASGVNNCVIDKCHPVYKLFFELNRKSKTLENIIKIIDFANDQASHIKNTIDIQQQEQQQHYQQQLLSSNSSPQQQQYLQQQKNLSETNYYTLQVLQEQKQQDNEVFRVLLNKCLDILLLVSDSTVLSIDDAKCLVSNLSNMNKSKPIVSITKLIDYESPAVALRALRLVYSFETYTRRISTVFLENNPDDIILRFVKMMEYNETNFEDFSGSVYTQYVNFALYTSSSVQWTIAQLILLCLSECQPNTYTLGHFLLGCCSNIDLSKDFVPNSRSCLTLILKHVQDAQFVERYPHLVECFHEIIYKMVKDPVTYSPMLKFINEEYPSYYRNSMEVLTNSIAINGGSERKLETLISSLSWVLNSCAISIQNYFSLDMKQFLSNYIFPAMNIHSTMMIMSSINVLTLYNTIEYPMANLEVSQPRLFSIYPQLDSNNCANSPIFQTSPNGITLLNIPKVRELLESDRNRFSNQFEIDKELEDCCYSNLTYQLVNAKKRALESWKSFVMVSLCQNTIEIEVLDENLLLSLLQRIVTDFANERKPVESCLAIGNTITTILSILKDKKQNYQLFSQTMSAGENDIIEQKMKLILEGLLQAVLKSPHYIIRGLSYICLIQYLDLTEQPPAASSSSSSPSSPSSLQQQEQIQLINDLNLNLVSKIEDKFIRTLSSDCTSFSRGWRIAALSCLQAILSVDNLCGHRTLLFLQNKGFIINMIVYTSNFLSNDWENIESKDLYVYRSQMSLLLKISQQMDGVHILINNGVIKTFVDSSFLNYIPTDKISNKFSEILLPILKLFASLCLYYGNHSNHSGHHNDKHEIYQDIFNFLMNHSELFTIILSDNNKEEEYYTYKNLEILKLTCYLFSKVSFVFFKKQSQQDQSKEKARFLRFHYCLTNLLIKYSTNSKKIIEKTIPDDKDQEELASKIDFSYSAANNIKHHDALNKKKNQFQILIKQMICSITHDLLMYCRKVSILTDQRIGFTCFNSNLNILNFGSSFSRSNQNSMVSNPSGSISSNSKLLPSLDLAINFLIDNIIQYTFYKMDSNQCQKLLDNYEQLTYVQYQEILQNSDTLTPSQRNHMVLNILKQKINDIETQISTIFDNIELLLILIVTHSYYFSNQLGILFQSNQISPVLSSSQFNHNNNSKFEISDLNNSTIGNKQQQQQTTNRNGDVFLQSKPHQNGGVLSSVFSIFKSHQENPPKISMNQTPAQNQQSLTNSRMVLPLQQSQLSQPHTPPQSELSNQEIDTFLKRLKQSIFDREINQLGGIKLSDAILNRLDKKSTIIDLMLKKLQDLTK